MTVLSHKTRAVLWAATMGTVVSVVLLGATLALAAGDANRYSCPSSTESSPGFRTYLPDCRAYELVSPPYKADGSDVAEVAVAADGEHVLASVPAGFAGAGNYIKGSEIYELSRTREGWQPTALPPPAGDPGYNASGFVAASASDELATTLWAAHEQAKARHFFLRLHDGTRVGVGRARPQGVEAEGPELSFAGASRDLSHLLFSLSSLGQALWPGDTTSSGASLYEYVGTCESEGECEMREPVLVGVKNDGSVVHVADEQHSAHLNEAAEVISDCGTELGAPGSSVGVPSDVYNAVSASGETIFFTAMACKGAPEVNEIYARLDGRETVAVSEPSKTACAVCQTSSTETTLKNAIFQGASEDGSKVFFLTEQELLPGQKGMNLYEYDFGAPAGERIKLVSNGSTEPMVRGVVRVSENGGWVYFVAEGVLSGKDVEGNAPDAEAGSDNLYVYNTVAGGNPVFVSTLMSPTLGLKIIGELGAWKTKAETECDGAVECKKEVSSEDFAALSSLEALWQQADEREAQATSDGRFLVFSSWADLTRDDTSTLPQLFEYDAQAQRLTRISIGQNGYRQDGNLTWEDGSYQDVPRMPVQRFTAGSRPTAAQTGLATSPDGGHVVFTSAAELAAGVSSGTPQVFEYESGNVHLLSDGVDAHEFLGTPDVDLWGLAAATESPARDVFFATADSLVPQDGESQVSLYDARADGGFPGLSPAPGCLAGACRGAAALTPRVGGASTAGQAPGGNLARTRRAKHRGKAHRRRHHHRHKRQAPRHHRRHHVTRRGK